jgi:hypothetical protein
MFLEFFVFWEYCKIHVVIIDPAVCYSHGFYLLFRGIEKVIPHDKADGGNRPHSGGYCPHREYRFHRNRPRSDSRIRAGSASPAGRTGYAGSKGKLADFFNFQPAFHLVSPVPFRRFPSPERLKGGKKDGARLFWVIFFIRQFYSRRIGVYRLFFDGFGGFCLTK